MKRLDEMLKAGCHFCNKPLTVETARCGTMQIRLAGSDVWSEPIAILCCHECEERHAG